MLSTKPTDLKDLAEQLLDFKAKRVTALAELLGVPSAKDFFDALPADAITEYKSPGRHIPIVREVVSTKNHDYTVDTHIVFWLADGEPYIFTPSPTIDHNRTGREVKKLKRGPHLLIPHNCTRYHLLALKNGCDIHKNQLLDLKISTSL